MADIGYAQMLQGANPTVLRMMGLADPANLPGVGYSLTRKLDPTLSFNQYANAIRPLLPPGGGGGGLGGLGGLTPPAPAQTPAPALSAPPTAAIPGQGWGGNQFGQNPNDPSWIQQLFNFMQGGNRGWFNPSTSYGPAPTASAPAPAPTVAPPLTPTPAAGGLLGGAGTQMVPAGPVGNLVPWNGQGLPPSVSYGATGGFGRGAGGLVGNMAGFGPSGAGNFSGVNGWGMGVGGWGSGGGGGGGW